MMYLIIPTWIIWAIPAGFALSVVLNITSVVIYEKDMRIARQQIRAAYRAGRDFGWKARGRATREYLRTTRAATVPFHAPAPPTRHLDPPTLEGTIVR